MIESGGFWIISYTIERVWVIRMGGYFLLFIIEGTPIMPEVLLYFVGYFLNSEIYFRPQ